MSIMLFLAAPGLGISVMLACCCWWWCAAVRCFGTDRRNSHCILTIAGTKIRSHMCNLQHMKQQQSRKPLLVVQHQQCAFPWYASTHGWLTLVISHIQHTWWMSGHSVQCVHQARCCSRRLLASRAREQCMVASSPTRYSDATQSVIITVVCHVQGKCIMVP